MTTSSSPHPLSKRERVEEIVKCGNDPIYFLNKYAKIQHPERGTLPFDTYKFQDDVINALEEHRFNIIVKSRQLGLSTIAAGYATWLALFHKDKNILVIATKLETAINFIKKSKFILKSIPDWMLLTSFDENKKCITFHNGSQILAIPTSEDAGRSEALSLLIVDEAALIKDFEDIWTGLLPTISTGGRALLISTPYGVGGIYHKLWVEAEAGVNGFNAIRLPWNVHPEHDETWFKNETKSMSQKKISQEYLCVGGDTKIITPDGYKLACELNVGDRVLTHMGRFCAVTAVNSRVARDDETLYEVSSPGSRRGKFVLTSNHPMLSYRFWANNVSSLGWLEENPCEPSWIEAGIIAEHRKTTDRIINVLFPRVKSNEVGKYSMLDVSTLYPSVDVTDETCRYFNQWGSTKRYVSVDFDLGKFIGLYLAEGCKRYGGLDMAFHVNEMDTHAKWCVDFMKALGCKTTLEQHPVHNSCRLWTYNKHIGALVRSFVLGNFAHDKCIDFDRVVACGYEFIKGLLYGHHLGDGNHVHLKKTCAYSTSSKLIYQLRTLNSMFGLYPRIGHVEFNKINPLHHDMWYLEFQAEGTSYLDLLEHGQQYKSKSRTRLVNGSFVGRCSFKDVSYLRDIDGGYTVYDISVDGDASFVAQSTVLHNCDFASSGDTYLQPNTLDHLRSVIRNPIERDGKNVWIWKKPEQGSRYIVSADVARGDSNDFSAFHVICIDSLEIVAEYLGKIPPEKLAALLSNYGRVYNEALICPENNSFGYFTCRALQADGYKRLYYSKHRGDPFNYIPTDMDELPGFSTQTKTRNQVLTNLEEMLRNKVITSYSQRLYDQLQTFVWNGQKPMALGTAHDDLVISLAIGCWLISGESVKSEQTSEYASVMLKGTSVMRRDSNELPCSTNAVQPVGNPNMRGYSSSTVSRPRDPSQVRIGEASDFGWLLK